MADAATNVPADSRSHGARILLWGPGLIVAVGAGAVTAHGLYVVATAAGVPAEVAWLYPLITDGLAIVAYVATHRLDGRGVIYAWSIVITAAGLSGLAQALHLADTAAMAASPGLRFGVGAWPAVAAAVAAHLVYVLARSGLSPENRPTAMAAPSPSRAPEPVLVEGRSPRLRSRTGSGEHLDRQARDDASSGDARGRTTGTSSDSSSRGPARRGRVRQPP